jgi:cyclophilin family peptidyl-prolyl cis-trans isomerase/HEAT repeat protein
MSAIFLTLLLVSSLYGQPQRATTSIPKDILLRIIRAEDERRWDRDLGVLFSDKDPAVRKRAVLAAGRIGNERSVEMITGLLEKDESADVRAMAAFALGEVESGTAIKALNAQLDPKTNSEVRARAVEALGKIAAALPKTEEALAKTAREGILQTLKFEAARRSAPDNHVIDLAITAALRARPEGAGAVIAEFLTYSDPIPSVAANALARLRAKDGNAQLVKLLVTAKDPIVRANAARVLGATEEASAFDALSERASQDPDSRVRISSIRALASLKDARAIPTLLTIGKKQISRNEALEIATALGRLSQGKDDPQALEWLKAQRKIFQNSAPEIEVALVRIAPAEYVRDIGPDKTAQAFKTDWHAASSMAQGLGEIAALADTVKDKAALSARAQEILRSMLSYDKPGAPHSEYAIPDVLRAYAAFKTADLAEVLRKHLSESDVIVRATAADLLGELPPDPVNADALIKAWNEAKKDKLNDAQLSILEALSKQKSDVTNEVIKNTLVMSDRLIRTRAVGYLKENGAGDFSSQVSVVATGKTREDYERAVARIGKSVRARVVTSRGSFTIELLPEEAPLNVDNFVQLARSGYFRGITFHRVVPNFVVQGGDPRGDGSGGPGYSVRCEINEVPYDRGAVGMALSGKDTGGSQWFVTHSPQPHLDGGYTVFGRVVSGMEVVDEIVRGDVIKSIEITER